MTSAAPFLMFQNQQAQPALDLYTATVPNSQIQRCIRYDESGPGPVGAIKLCVFTIAGTEFMCFDSPIPHEFNFTASFSIFVEVTDAAEFTRLYETLSAGGKIRMLPDDYDGLTQRFAWFSDRFGVSWQLNLAN